MHRTAHTAHQFEPDQTNDGKFCVFCYMRGEEEETSRARVKMCGRLYKDIINFKIKLLTSLAAEILILIPHKSKGTYIFFYANKILYF